MEDILKKLIKNEEVMELLRKAGERKSISYEEINESLGDDVSTKEIEQLINGMIEHGIKIVNKKKSDDTDEDEDYDMEEYDSEEEDPYYWETCIEDDTVENDMDLYEDPIEDDTEKNMADFRKK